ncbi:MAG: hypothetical protein ABW205_01420 [Burkholderiales bacterium]
MTGIAAQVVARCTALHRRFFLNASVTRGVYPCARTGPSRPHRRKGTKLRQSRTLADKLDQRVFDAIYSRSLVYNTCCEDPAVDRRALCLSPDHLPYLETRFEALCREEHLGLLPYVPGVRVPWYLFVGRKPTKSESG